jgi:endonuclease/exonuclease/phosphatase family metal-dependent hydrolase
MKALVFTILIALSVSVAAQNYTVVTYNIRYKNKHDGDDKWDNRKAKVAAIIKDNNTDIVGLQEAKAPQVNYLNRELKGYAYVGVGRDDGKTKGEYSPIFYKKDKFTLLDKGWFWLSETPAKPSKGWDAACPRICTWVVLRDTATKKEFSVFNTHLDHKGTLARQNGVQLIIDSLQKKLEKYGIQPDTVSYMPGHALLMGDFNFMPENANYERVANDGNFTLTPRYDSYVVATSKPLGTVGTTNAFELEGEYKNRIDYVWVTSGFVVNSYQTINEKTAAGRWPSDHFPVKVNISLK